MRFAIQAILEVYGPDWQGSVRYTEDGDIAEVLPTEGCTQPDLVIVALKHAEIAPRLVLITRLQELDGVVTREREDLMQILGQTPTSGPIAEAVAEKKTLRLTISNLV